MQKIKGVLSGHRKSLDTNEARESSDPGHGAATARVPTGEGSHPSGVQYQRGPSDEHHPIYDQFASQKAPTGTPTKTTDHAPHFSNTTNLSNPPDSAKDFSSPGRGESTPTSSLRPDSTQTRPSTLAEEASTASIKSGVIGFPQGEGTHAALQEHPLERDLDTTQAQGGSDLPLRTANDQQQGSSNLERDAAIGAGTLGAGAATAHELHHQRGSDDLRSSQHQNTNTAHPVGDHSAGRDFAQSSKPTSEQPFERSFHEPEVTQDTDRSFPLAGGVTSRKQAENVPNTQGVHSHPPVTSDKASGPKDMDARLSEHHGREGLAGAAAAAATAGAASSLPQSDRHRQHDDRTTLGGAAGAPVASLNELRAEHELRSGHLHDQGHENRTANTVDPTVSTTRTGTDTTGTHGREALAGATAAGLASSAIPRPEHGSTREHVGQDPQTYSGRDVPGNHHEQGHGREALAAATAAGLGSSAIPRPEQGSTREHLGQEPQGYSSRDVPAHDHEQGHGREALAAATAAMAASSIPQSERDATREPASVGSSGAGGVTVDKPSSGHLFTRGPHVTDTANRLDPHLHIPGEFPETPLETPVGEKGAGGYISGPSGRSQSTSIETPTSGGAVTNERPNVPVTAPASTSTDPKLGAHSAREDQHHYGRDAAVAGGVGAAGLGAYEAGKHNQREPTDVGGETAPAHSSPYSSTKLDPRVMGKSAGFEEQRVDPTAHTSPATHGTQPNTSQPSSQIQTGSPQKEHHYGRDAGLVGAGAATAGGLAYASQHDEKSHSGPASDTIGPHKSNVANILDPKVQPNPAVQKHHHAGPTSEDPASATVGPHKSNIANILDPRVLPEPEKQKGHTIPGPHKSDTLNRLDPNVDSKAQPEGKHLQRDAAIAPGYSAHEVAKPYDEHRSTQPAASMNEQRYDPAAPGAHDPTQTGQHHYGRDAAIAGGVGAAGAGALAYASSGKGHETQEDPSFATSQHQPASQTYSQPAVSQHPTSHATQPTVTQQYSSKDYEPYQNQTQNQTPEHHYGRDAAVAGGLGATGAGVYAASKHHDDPTRQAQTYQQQPAVQQPYGSAQDPNQQHKGRDLAAAGAGAGVAGAGAGYAYSQQQEKEAEKARLAQEKAQQKELDHQRKAEQKELEHQHKAEQKAHDKDVEHQRKEQQKELEHKQKEEQKAFAAQQKAIEKEHAKEEKHHNKVIAAEEEARRKELEKERTRQQEEAERAKHAEESPKEKKHGLFGFLHRDKDKKNSPERSPRHSTEHPATTAGAYAGEVEGRNKLHKDPPPGHPAREAVEAIETGKHQRTGTDGPIGRSNEIPDDHETRAGAYGAHPDSVGEQHQTVTEPHTGLPMNIEKYGTDGRGGTDGSRTVEGYHEAPGTQTDWDAIKKGNTLY